MSGRFRLAPALLVVTLGVALVLYMSPSRAGSTVNPSPARAVSGVAIPVTDMERSIAFYSTVLFFEKVSDVETAGPEIESLFGASGRIRVVAMRLGSEQIELVDYGDQLPIAVQAPDSARSSEHIAIVVNDLDQALLWLRRNHVAQTAPEPDRDPNANGVRSLSIEDPDGHALEILQFQAGKGDARWQRPSDRVFLGIDHAAIVVGDTETSLRFYRDLLGLRVVGGSESAGTEQEILDDGPGGRPRVTTLRAAKGPAIQLLEYHERKDLRSSPRDAGDDRASWRTVLMTADASGAAGKLANASGAARPAVVSLADAPLGFRRGFATEDPDGNGIQFRSR
jgi:catechol 2,3-dioxygenase-like lactoylglutathione lyase family enzyme